MLLIFMNVSFGQDKLTFINSQVVELRSKRKRKQGAVTVFTWASKGGMSVIDNVLVDMVVKNIPLRECYHASYITVFMR